MYACQHQATPNYILHSPGSPSSLCSPHMRCHCVLDLSLKRRLFPEWGRTKMTGQHIQSQAYSLVFPAYVYI